MTLLYATELRDHVMLLDIDGTLVPEGKTVLALTDEVRDWVRTLSENNEVYLCSNKKLHSRNKEIAAALGVGYIESTGRKPSLHALGTLPVSRQRVVIGDKFLTDGLLAINLRCRFVRVRRIVSAEDALFDRMLYRLDDLIYAAVSPFLHFY